MKNQKCIQAELRHSNKNTASNLESCKISPTKRSFQGFKFATTDKNLPISLCDIDIYDKDQTRLKEIFQKGVSDSDIESWYSFLIKNVSPATEEAMGIWGRFAEKFLYSLTPDTFTKYWTGLLDEYYKSVEGIEIIFDKNWTEMLLFMVPAWFYTQHPDRDSFQDIPAIISRCLSVISKYLTVEDTTNRELGYHSVILAYAIYACICYISNSIDVLSSYSGDILRNWGNLLDTNHNRQLELLQLSLDMHLSSEKSDLDLRKTFDTIVFA